MAYNDPYYSQQHQQYPPQPNYSDGPEFDPYNQHQRHPTYDQSGYGYTDDDGGFPRQHANPDENDFVNNDMGVGAERPREKGQYDEPGFPPPAHMAGFRSWRKESYGNMWTKGSRGKCILRFACCTLFLFLFLLISIVLTLLVYIRPPDIQVNSVGLNSTGGTPFSVSSSEFTLNLGIAISVDNPNFFDVDFSHIKANLTYPTNNMPLGGGEEDSVNFKSHTQTTFNFPLTLTYVLADDTGSTVLTDLLNKCGITSSTKSDITVDYKIVLGLKIVFFTINPSFSSSFSFTCPFSESDISALLGSAGLNIGSVTGSS